MSLFKQETNNRDNMNELTEAQRERLCLLIEECAEVQHIACKILRHGFNAHNPDDTSHITNKQLLNIEVGHVLSAIELLCVNNDLVMDMLDLYKGIKTENVRKYLYEDHKFPTDEQDSLS